MPPLVACPKCEQHTKVSEDACPHCGAALRDTRGRILRTATAAVLGLAATTASCKKAHVPVDEYGPAPTMTLDEPVAEYGPAPTMDDDDDPSPDPSSSARVDPDAPPADEPVDEYGPPPTID